MASGAVSARLRYLSDSAHLLAGTAPATSAHLMSQCNGLMFDNDLEPSDAYRRKSCGACGNIMLPGISSKMHKETREIAKRKGKSDKRGSNPSLQARAIVYKCSFCQKNTRLPLPTTTSTAIRKSTKNHSHAVSLKATSSVTPGNSASESSTPTSANASSKKRAKSRKHGGLQALLAKKNEPQSSGFGLDLMDLMKRS